MLSIAIIGAGAMGSVYGACLSQVSEVLLIDIWKEHVNEINENGLKVEWIDGREKLFKLEAFTSPEDCGKKVDLVIVFVKSYVTEKAVSSSSPLLKEDTLFLTLQNGLGNAEKIASLFGKDRVLCGTTTFGATMLGPGRVRLAGIGETSFGPFGTVERERLKRIYSLFEEAGLNPHLVDDPMRNVWRKLLINVGINPITAIAGVPNGFIVEDENLRKLSGLLVEEACLVAESEGYGFNANEVKNLVLDVARKTGKNRSSMLQDISAGRRTEIDAINGEIVARGRKKGLSVSGNEAITLLIKFLEKKAQEGGGAL